MDGIKSWFIEVAVKKMGPSAIRSVIVLLTGWLVAHSGKLHDYGIDYDSATNILSLHFDSLQHWLETIGLMGACGAIVKMLNHHADVAILPKPTEDKSVSPAPQA